MTQLKTRFVSRLLTFHRVIDTNEAPRLKIHTLVLLKPLHYESAHLSPKSLDQTGLIQKDVQMDQGCLNRILEILV